MAYTKHTWVNDELITADKLNNLEAGALDLSIPIGGATGTDVLPSGVTSIVGLIDYYIKIYKSKFEKTIIASNSSLTDSPSSYDASVTIDIVVRDIGRSYVRVSDPNGGFYFASYTNGKLESAWVMLAKDSNVLHKTGDESASGNKTFSGTVTTTGYLKQKRWSTTVSIGGNTFILNRIGDVVFASGTVTTTLTGNTTASGKIPTGFIPYANFVVSTNRGVGSGTLLFQSNGSVWVPATVNVDSYISGTYLAQDTLPTV